MNKLMTHFVAGYPTLKESEKLAKTMIDSGASFMEMQIPFSDSIADGPIISRANQEAIKKGITVDDCLKLLERLTTYANIPLLVMTYFNIPFKYGVEKFCRDAKNAGAYGLIVPDMPFEEEKNEHFYFACQKYDLMAILIITPLTSEKRLAEIDCRATGFVYCAARTGITGKETSLDRSSLLYLSRVKKKISIPLAVGFGVATPDQVQILSGIADIIVVGSALIKVYQGAGGNKIKAVGDFVKLLVS